MKTVVLTLRNKATGERFVFYERVHDTVKPRDVWHAIRKASKGVALIKMTVRR